MYPTLPHREGRLIPFVISSRHLLARIPGFHPGKGRSILPGRTSLEGEGITLRTRLGKVGMLQVTPRTETGEAEEELFPQTITRWVTPDTTKTPVLCSRIERPVWYL